MSSSAGYSRIGRRLPATLYGYDILGYLGTGAGSRIFAASDPATNQVYALKHVVVKKEKDVRFVEQLINEFEVSRKVNHPLLRQCIDLKVTKKLLRGPTEAALVMEMVDGVSCDVDPPKTVAQVLDVLYQTAMALHGMHVQGFLHCDLKPNNILVRPDGRVKIIDLGQACKINSVKKRIQGTPDFIAPEQVRCEPLTIKTDVYNWGATAYAMLTDKKVPTLATIKRGKNSFLSPDAVPSPASLNPKVPNSLSSLIMECVHSLPARRPSGMPEVQQRIEPIQEYLGNNGDATPDS